MAVITYPLNGVTYHAEDAEGYLCTRTSGIYSAEECFGLTITDDMEVTIGSGQAWIKNDTFSGKSVISTEPVALTVGTAHATLSRIDRVVIEFTTAQNASELKIVQGTPAANPAAPAIVQTATQYQLGLYTVRVPASSTEVQAQHITDTRLNEGVCGVMRDGVEKIPTQTLLDTFTTTFNTWLESIQDILDEDTAGHLLTLINGKLNIPTVETSLPASGTALAEDTIYTVAAAVTSYQFVAPSGGKWAHGTFTTGNTPNITFSSSAKFLSAVPDFDDNTTYEFDVKDNVWAVTEVVSE